jgi:UDP-N-acetylglucosamine acyltransferase
MPKQHPTAIVDPNARLGSEVEIGPFCLIGPDVEIGDGCRLHSHVVVEGHTTLGPQCEVFPFASLGHRPQDLKFKGEASRLVIGARNTIREGVTMNPGTEGGGLVTQVGSDCLFMAQSHVAHDCQVGDHVILANAATLGGHCVVEDHVIFGGLSAARQFVRIGAYAFIGGMSGIDADVIPFAMVIGIREGLAGLNLVGMKRQGFSRDEIQGLRKAYAMLFADEGTLQERAQTVAETFSDNRCVMRVVDFIRADTSRALTLPRQSGD